MPYIEIRTTETVPYKKKKAITDKFVASWAETSNKQVAANIQLVFSDGCFIDFRGDCSLKSTNVQICPGPMTTKEDYAAIVGGFFRVLGAEMDVPDDRIYITVSEIQNWGFAGRLL